jgi:hypothetical protein
MSMGESSGDASSVKALQVIEERSASSARRGLGMAIGDILEESDGCPGELKRRVDEQLAAERLPTLSELRARFGRDVRAILRRGSVRSDVDYYALRNVVDDLADSERGRAWDILAAYEDRVARRDG